MFLLLVRFIIAVAAAVEVAYFIIEMPFPYGTMLSLNARWFDILSGYAMAVGAPLTALAALALAATGRRIGVAAILLAVALCIYWAPIAAAVIGFMIYGF